MRPAERSEYSHEVAQRERANIRRRLRTQGGVAQYTLKILLEALRHHGLRLPSARIVLMGFARFSDSPTARTIRDTLDRHGANIRFVEPEYARDDDSLLADTDAVVIATDHPAFHTLRPRQFKRMGIHIVVPTTLRGE